MVLSSRARLILAQQVELRGQRKPGVRFGQRDILPNAGTRDPDDYGLRGKRAAVVLCSYYPADPRPRRSAEALVAAGMEVDVICLREQDTEPNQESVNGVNVFRLPWKKSRGGKFAYLKHYGRFLFSSFAFLGRRSMNRKYDIVHVHNMPDVLVFSALVPKLQGAVVILDLHDPMPELMMSIFGVESGHWLVRMLRILERWSIHFADLALTPNIAFKKLFVSRSCHAEKMQIVMNAPEEQIFDPARVRSEEDRLPNDQDFRIMHHGTLVHRHGIDILVEAIAHMRPKIPGLHLDLYGSHTPFLDTVLDLAERLGVADIVHYHGAKPQTEIARAIHRCDVGVVPNRRSAFTEINLPTRLFEYLAMNRAVIAPSTQGIRDYFSPEQLFMFEPDNVDDLAAKMLFVRANPQTVQRTIEAGRRVYRENLWRVEKVRFLDHVATLLRVKSK